jgi:archaemetzincin
MERQQYSSTQILAALAARQAPSSRRLLGIISADLYIPILTFVFGEAQLNGSCAIASTFRLRQEFYGLPADPNRLLSRLAKESTHELGHILGLRHCDNVECVMAPSHSIEWVDLKKARFCPSCSEVVAGLKAKT